MIALLLALASGATFFAATRRWLGTHAATIGAGCYVALPYHVIDAYERFTLGEFAAFVWLPLVFASAERISAGRSRSAWVGLATSYAALVATHLVTGFLTAFALAPFFAVRIAQRRAWPRAIRTPTALRSMESADRCGSISRT